MRIYCVPVAKSKLSTAKSGLTMELANSKLSRCHAIVTVSLWRASWGKLIVTNDTVDVTQPFRKQTWISNPFQFAARAHTMRQTENTKRNLIQSICLFQRHSTENNNGYFCTAFRGNETTQVELHKMIIAKTKPAFNIRSHRVLIKTMKLFWGDVTARHYRTANGANEISIVSKFSDSHSFDWNEAVHIIQSVVDEMLRGNIIDLRHIHHSNSTWHSSHRLIGLHSSISISLQPPLNQNNPHYFRSFFIFPLSFSSISNWIWKNLCTDPRVIQP